MDTAALSFDAAPYLSSNRSYLSVQHLPSDRLPRPELTMIRILVVEDQQLFRESLSHLFGLQSDMEVAGQCSSPEEALRILRQVTVDVLIASGRLGPQFVSAVRQGGGVEAIVVITDGLEPEKSLASLHCGARAILSRYTSSETLTRAIRVVASGGAWLDQHTVELLASGARPAPAGAALSEREQRIVRGISDGLTNRRIAEGLGLSEGAVKAALHRLYAKTQTRTRAQLLSRTLDSSPWRAAHSEPPA
jgi:DNA-binding NarL/FixJ family response regulator